MNGVPRVRPMTAKAPSSGSRLPVPSHCGQLMSQPSPAGPNQPARSTTRCTDPLALRSSTWPSAPTRARTAFATVRPGAVLRLLLFGSGEPCG